MKKYLSQLGVILFFCFPFSSSAQSFRGMAVVNDSLCWVSGSGGSVLRTPDGGQSWETRNPAGYAQKDFRDIHAFDALVAVVMSAGDSAVILRTQDGGISWKLVHSCNRPGVFYDAMDFEGQTGVVIGDPYLDSASGEWYFDRLFSCDGGETWNCQNVLSDTTPWKALPGQAIFAASGSNVNLVPDPAAQSIQKYYVQYVTGGSAAQLCINGLAIDLPYDTCLSCGVYGFLFYRNQLVFIGGNYLEPEENKQISYLTAGSRGLTWSATQPGGYRSCVAASIDGSILVCTGPNGTDVSLDQGLNWRPLKISGFHVCAFSSNYLWLAGSGGRIERIPVRQLDQMKR